MKFLIVLSAVVAMSLARPGYLAGGLAGIAAPFAAPVAYQTVVAPAVISSQHHAQDTLGQYNYGYADGLSVKGEIRTADGVTRGGYSYLDAEGNVQNVAYTADAAGFRVAASNLPEAPAVPETPALEAPKPVEDTAEVAAAKAAHQTAVAEAETRAAADPALDPAPDPTPAPAPAVVDAPAPAAVIAAPAPAVVAAAPAISIAAPGFIHPGGFAYNSIAAAPLISAPAFSYSSIAAPTLITAQGVPVDTPEVQAARAADAIAHLNAKAAIFG